MDAGFADRIRVALPSEPRLEPPARSAENARIATLEEENKRLRQRIEKLEAERRVRSSINLALINDELPYHFLGLTRGEARIMKCLMESSATGNTMPKGMLLDEVYVGRYKPSAKIVDVLICKMRRKLASHGVTITTDWGRGYRLDGENRERVLGFLRSHERCSPKSAPCAASMQTGGSSQRPMRSF